MARWRQEGGAIRFAVRLTPKGGRDALDGWTRDAAGRDQLKVRVAAPPEDGKANSALIALLAGTLDVPKSAIQIVAGATARLKIVAVRSTSHELAARLEALGDAT